MKSYCILDNIRGADTCFFNCWGLLTHDYKLTKKCVNIRFWLLGKKHTNSVTLWWNDLESAVSVLKKKTNGKSPTITGYWEYCWLLVVAHSLCHCQPVRLQNRVRSLTKNDILKGLIYKILHMIDLQRLSVSMMRRNPSGLCHQMWQVAHCQ